MKPLTVAQAWDDYREIVISQAGPARVRDCKIAFYAGAESFMTLVTRADEDDVIALRNELLVFRADLKAGRI